MYIRCVGDMCRLYVVVLLVRSFSKRSPSSFSLCAFRASVDGVCFILTARGAGGRGRVMTLDPRRSNAQNVSLHLNSY